MTLQEILASIITNFGSFGIVSWLAGAIIIQIQQRKHIELSNDAKRGISIATAVVIVAIAYFAGALLGYWPITTDSLIHALGPIFAELGGAKIIFAATKKAENTAQAAPANNPPPPPAA